jgi:hypothetical protein
MDSQSVKTTVESAHPSGYDAHKIVRRYGSSRMAVLALKQSGWISLVELEAARPLR